MPLQFVTNQFKDSAVTNAKIADSTIAFAKLAAAAYETDLSSSASSSKLVTAAASKAYADSVASGLDLKESCMVATTANISLSGTQTIDGVSVTAGKRVLVKDQSTGSENGIYVCAAGSWARATDFAAGSAEAGAFTFIEQGTANGDNGFVCTNNAGSDVVGTNALVFTQFSGAGQITAGDGLAKSGNTLSVNVDDSSIEISSDALRVKASGVTNAMLAGSISAAKLAGSIGNDKLSNSSVSFGGVSVALGASDATPAFDLADATNYPTSSLVGTISNAQLAGSIANAKLANSSISLGGISVALGGSDATPAFDLADATNYPTSSLVGTITNAQLAGSIADSKLNAISTAGKVLLSALEIDGGTDIGADLVDADLMIVDDGAAGTNRKSALSRVKKYIYSAMSGDATASDAGVLTIANDAVEQAMIADDAVGADQLAASAVVTASIVDSNVTFAKAAFVPHQESFTGDGSTTAFNLTNRIATAAWRQSIIVFRNGQKINFNGSPSDSSQYSISDNGSATTVTLGAAPASGEDVTLFYIYE